MKKIILSLSCFLLCVYVANAQVSIGTTNPAKTGALLDLRQNDNTGVNSVLGMKLPRVNVPDSKLLSPMLDDYPEYKTDISEKSKQDALHIGLVVYNLNQCLFSTGSDQGMVVWGDDGWKPIAAAAHSNVLVNKDQEGNTFYSVKFGTGGEWMLSNAKATLYDTRSGLAGLRMTAPMSPTNTSLEGFVWGYPNQNGQSMTSSSIYDKQNSLGLLYNFNAALGVYNDEITLGNQQEGASNQLNIGTQGICPDGWHIPSDTEWNKMLEQVYNTPSGFSSVNREQTWNKTWDTAPQVDNIADILLLSCYPVDSESSIGQGKSFAANRGGFASILAGHSSVGNTAANYATETKFWTASIGTPSPLTAFVRGLNNSNNTITRDAQNGNSLLSVRCKRNEIVPFTQCGDPLVDDEGNVYSTALFGNKCWMTDNLRVKANYDPSTNTDIAYPDPDQHTEEYGLLYSWQAATQSTSASPQYSNLLMPEEIGDDNGNEIKGLCPSGWHIPNDYEWAMLEKEIASNPTKYSSGTASITVSDPTLNSFSWRPDSGKGWGDYMLASSRFQPTQQGNGLSNRSTNAGFAAYMSGLGDYNNSLDGDSNFGTKAYFWSSSISMPALGVAESARFRAMRSDDDKVERHEMNVNYKLSVRCVLNK